MSDKQYFFSGSLNCKVVHEKWERVSFGRLAVRRGGSGGIHGFSSLRREVFILSGKKLYVEPICGIFFSLNFREQELLLKIKKKKKN